MRKYKISIDLRTTIEAETEKNAWDKFENSLHATLTHEVDKITAIINRFGSIQEIKD